MFASQCFPKVLSNAVTCLNGYSSFTCIMGVLGVHSQTSAVVQENNLIHLDTDLHLD